MKILYIVPNPPSLVRVRPYNLIRHLCARGHQLTVATVWSNEEERSDVKHLRGLGIAVMAAPLPKGQIVRNLFRALATGAPLQAYYAYSPILAGQLQRLLGSVEGQRFDLVHVEHLRGAQYSLAIRSSQFAIPIVWDSVDCITYLFEQAAAHSRSCKGRLMARLELARTRRHEARLVRQFDRVLVTSDVDRQALIDLALRFTFHGSRFEPETITVIPNGVDLSYFTPSHELREPNTLVITGKMSYHANVTAALHLVNDIMPYVWAQRPDVKVWIVGKNPPQLVRALTIRNSSFAIQITGTVPDIRPYLRRATLAVAPMPYSAGIQNKVLEAMACATPVVANRQAVSALEAVDGEHLLVAEDAAAFAQHILDLLADKALQRRLGRAGRRYVEQHHDWNRIAERLERIYTELRAIR